MTDKANEFLEHYGVKGMKWGVRRTDAQLARSAKKDPNTPEGAVRAKRKSAVSNRRTISDKDLDALVDRLKKEKQLKDLVDEDVAPGKKFAKNIINDSGNKILKGVVISAAVIGLKQVTKATLGKEAADHVNIKK